MRIYFCFKNPWKNEQYWAEQVKNSSLDNPYSGEILDGDFAIELGDCCYLEQTIFPLLKFKWDINRWLDLQNKDLTFHPDDYNDENFPLITFKKAQLGIVMGGDFFASKEIKISNEKFKSAIEIFNAEFETKFKELKASFY